MRSLTPTPTAASRTDWPSSKMGWIISARPPECLLWDTQGNYGRFRSVCCSLPKRTSTLLRRCARFGRAEPRAQLALWIDHPGSRCEWWRFRLDRDRRRAVRSLPISSPAARSSSAGSAWRPATRAFGLAFITRWTIGPVSKWVRRWRESSSFGQRVMSPAIRDQREACLSNLAGLLLLMRGNPAPAYRPHVVSGHPIS
jgi:hypothetical protein